MTYSMRLFYAFLVPCLVLLAGTPIFGGSIIVNEIMQNPSAVSDTNGEWFEVYNTTGAAVDIDGWTISDNDTDSHMINNGGALNVPANGYLVLGRNGDTNTNGGVTVDYVYSGFILANTADEVILTDDVGPTESDRVEYDGGPNFPDPTGASMELGTNFQSMTGNDPGSHWDEGSTSFGDGDLGTPGAQNAFVPEPGAVTMVILFLMGTLSLRDLIRRIE